ncbi:MAG: PAS domain S-box protein [Actinomycetota bacterium]
MSSAASFTPEDFGIGRLFWNIRDAIVVANAATERIVLWNPCAAELFGYTEEEALSMPLHALVPERLVEVHRRGLAGYQETGEGLLIDSGTPVELAGQHKDGHEVPIELTLTKIPDVSPEGHRFALAIVRDLKDRKAAEDARAAYRELEIHRRQAAKLHDSIVQGLATAKMALELDMREKSAEAIEETLRRARDLVDDLLRGMAPKDQE